MKSLIALLATGWTFFILATAAQTEHPTPQRLLLLPADFIGMTDASQCALAKDSENEAAAMPNAAAFTEADIGTWDRATGRMGLASKSVSAYAAMQMLRDRCFVLYIDGNVLVRGVALASESARLTDLPTLRIFRNKDAPYLLLTSGNSYQRSQPFDTEVLDGVLGKRATLSQPLQAQSGDGLRTVQKLIDEQKIHPGVALADLITLLGRPSTYPHGYSGTYSWRIGTEQKAEAIFFARVKNGLVESYQWERK